jgi:pimeloyl-ACP methyl ester carboxylesterase
VGLVRSLFEPAQRGAIASTHLIVLPGAYQSPEDVIAAKFSYAMQKREIDADLSCVDLEPEFLTDRGALARLRDEIVAPSRRLGYAQLWLVGISLGGYVALDFVSSYPREIDGVCLLAPYLGSRNVAGEITAAGGLVAWSPGEIADDDEERRIWALVKSYSESATLVYLGFGRDDRFASTQRIMAAALPSTACRIIAGGHDWTTWLALWEYFLESGYL